MSTRCQIGFYPTKETDIEDYVILIYKHKDGYPKIVLPVIKSVIKKFSEYNDFSSYEYLSAWILYEFMSNHVELNAEKDIYITKLNIENDKIPAKDLLGYGISNNRHLDISYFYGVFPDRIDVFETGNYVNVYEWNKIQTINI